MKQSKSETLARVDENYIFYVCLSLVLAIAALGILVDMTGR